MDYGASMLAVHSHRNPKQKLGQDTPIGVLSQPNFCSRFETWENQGNLFARTHAADFMRACLQAVF